MAAVKARSIGSVSIKQILDSVVTNGITICAALAIATLMRRHVRKCVSCTVLGQRSR
ncbi:MAG: hypothetical protein AB1489_18640 [Acidobacteriota bacterium]